MNNMCAMCVSLFVCVWPVWGGRGCLCVHTCSFDNIDFLFVWAQVNKHVHLIILCLYMWMYKYIMHTSHWHMCVFICVCAHIYVC